MSSETEKARRWTHVDSVGSLLSDSSDRSHSSRVEHDLVVVDERVLVDSSKDVSTGDVVSDLQTREARKVSE